MQAGGAAEESAEYTPDPRRWKALAVCLVAGFMSLLDVSIVNVALPSIKVGLHGTQSDLQWVVSGYALTFGLVLVPSGRFGDARGRRNVFILGVAVFALASAGCGISPNAMLLIITRLIQGLAAGLLIPQVSGLIQQLFRGAERGRAFGLLGATIGISTAVGPLLGGVLIAIFGEREGWRYVFYVNVPIGALAILLAYRLIPARRPEQRRRQHLDPVGVILLGLGVVLLLLPLAEEQEWRGQAKWLLVVAAVGVFVAFIFWERRYGRSRDSLINLELFRRRSYALGLLIGLIYLAGFTATFFVFTLFLQQGKHYSALEAGVAVTPFAAGSAVSAALAGRVITKLGRPLVAAGLAMVALGVGGAVVAVHLVPGRGVGFATAAPLLLAGVGSGAVISPNLTLTLSEVPVREAGSAGGVLQTFQRIGSAIGIATVGSVFFATVASTHNDYSSAFQRAVLLSVAFDVVALCAALVDVFAGRAENARQRRADRAGRHA
ncbi:MFS transporter [Rugosimonospora acidiphila]|uniref:MFS transporter n=1 Tax=Rugosimonospora acidiphila TaxID=556531 RepID=A0ABP9RP07_9ACTN